MTPPTLPPQSQRPTTPIRLEEFRPSSFSDFGTAICPPISTSLTTPPTSIPEPLHSPYQPKPVFANQNSALKTAPVSQFTNKYPPSSQGSSPASQPQMSMFSCFPRNLSGIGIERPTTSSGNSELRFKVSILERHPYTTQTFSPLGLSASDPSTVFLVIVAPSLPSTTKATSSTGSPAQIANPPDLSRLRAFVARGDQAVTYGPGTWHAPMVVLGQRRVDFVVTQFVNGVPDDDCQEVLLGENSVAVDLGALGLNLIGEKAKL